LVIVGSDDVLSANYFQKVLEKLNDDVLAVGLQDFYFYDLIGHKLFYWKGYRQQSIYGNQRYGEPMGGGRCISRKALDILGWSLWDICRPIDKGLDLQCTNRLKQHRIMFDSFSMDDAGVFGVACKGSKLLSPIKAYSKRELILQEDDMMESVINDSGIKNMLQCIG